jgi:hypothetical protein
METAWLKKQTEWFRTVQQLAPCLTPSAFRALLVSSRTATRSCVCKEYYAQWTSIYIWTSVCHCALSTVHDESRFTKTNALCKPQIYSAFQKWDIIFRVQVVFRIHWEMSLDKSVSLMGRLRVRRLGYRCSMPGVGRDFCLFHSVQSRPDTYPDYPLGYYGLIRWE